MGSKNNFTHINDTDFPIIENVDVYKYKNNFDYNRWTDGTKIYLCNVLFNSDYKNVVKFDSDEDRDKYFDSLNGYTVELNTRFHIAPDNTVKVPIPYQVANRYNYLYVDLPIMTSEDNPINYESPRRTKRYFYFIEDIEQLAPSSTMLYVKIDNWTTFINNISIPFMILERGHAPMASITVDKYLSNPIENNQYLLAPDFDFADGEDIVSNSEFIPVNNGEKYIMFATTMSKSQVINQTYPPQLSGNTTPATFEDYNARWGYQYTVKNYDWNIGDYNYNGMITNTVPMQSCDNSIPNNHTIVACKASNANAMFSYMSEHIPFFFTTIKACFMVDSGMFNKGQQFTFCNVDCYIVEKAPDSILSTLKLTKDKFNFDSKYKDIAKLYTFPYSKIEVTDNNGITKTFKIENTSNIEIRKNISLAFPYLSIQTYLTGINGNGKSTYKWEKINDSIETKNMYADDFGEYLFNWDIPTYALYVKNWDVHKAAYYPNQYINRCNAIANYHKTVDIDNTEYENSKDAADTTQTMTNNSANTDMNNEYATANTNNTNTNNQADNLVNNTAIECAKSTDITANNNACSTGVTSVGNRTNSSLASDQILLSIATTDIENQQTSVTASMNSLASVASGAQTALSSAGAGNMLGVAGAAINAFAGVYAAGVTSDAVISANSATAAVGQGVTRANAITSNNGNSDTNTWGINTATKNTQVANNAITAQTNNTSSMMKTNAANTATTNKANASRTNSTTIENASLNRNTTVANSDYLRDVNIKNAKITLEQRRIENQQAYNSAKISSPVQYATNSGDMTLDAMERRGLQIKVRTERKSDIAQAGDLMLRYGYSLNQAWNIESSGFNTMKYFTYWKASDIWINEGEGVNQSAQMDIQTAFERGITVWSDPNKIGKVSIYDNRK